MYCGEDIKADPKPRENLPAMNIGRFVEKPWRRAASRTMKLPTKLMPRRPMIPANERNGARHTVPIVIKALIVAYVTPALPKPKYACHAGKALTPLMTAQSIPEKVSYCCSNVVGQLTISCLVVTLDNHNQRF